MKKFIYIFAIISIVFSVFALPISALVELNPEFQGMQLSYLETYIVDGIISLDLTGFRNPIILFNSLAKLGALRVYGDYNGENTLLSQRTVSKYGQEIILSQYRGVYTFEFGNFISETEYEDLKFLLTIIEGGDDESICYSDYYSSLIECLIQEYPDDGSFIDGWNTYFDSYLAFFVDYMTNSTEAYKYKDVNLNSMISEWKVTLANGQTRTLRGVNLNTLYDAGIQYGYELGYEQGVKDVSNPPKKETFIYDAEGEYVLSLFKGDTCTIVFNCSLPKPKFSINYKGSWVGGLSVASTMREGLTYTFEAPETGDYIFKFYDTSTNVPGVYTITRFVSSNLSADYLLGYNEGYNQALKDNPDDGSYNEGYNDGYNQGALDNANSGYQDGYTAGYNQGALDNANSGYQEGYNAGYNQALKDNPDDGNYNQGIVDGEANILNQMREYMIAQGLNPQGNSVESLLAYYASALNSNSNNNWQDGYNVGYEEGYNTGYEEGYNNGVVNAEWQYKVGYSYGVAEGKRLICNDIRSYMIANGVDDETITDNNAYSLLTYYDAQKGNGFSNIYNKVYEDLKDDIEKSTNEIKGSIDETANGSFIQGFLAGMWNGMTGFISMILTGITFSGLSLMNILATALAILSVAFVIKMIKG